MMGLLSNSIKYIIAFQRRGQGHEFGADFPCRKTLTPAQYGDLADVPAEVEWLANIAK
jgi:hypothetical protein